MKKILLIQSRLSSVMIEAEHEGYSRILKDHKVEALSTLDDSVSWSTPESWLVNYDAVIIGGSGDLDFDGGRAEHDEARIISQQLASKMRPFVEYLLTKDFPTLGICYGHQLVSECLGVKVINDHEQKKVGTYEVCLTAEGRQDRLLANLPDKFLAQYGHKDSLSTIPNGATLLATGERCRTSLLRFGHNFYTMQFHPELDSEEVRWKLQNSPGYLPEGVDLDDLVKDSDEASRIIPNFVNLVA